MSSNKMCLYDHETITVEYLPEKGMIFHTVHKPTGGQVLRDALVAGSDALKQYGLCKWLSDDRLNGPLSAEDIQWAVSNWHLPTIQDGWKFWAIVVPEEVISAGSMIPTINNLYELGLRVMVFPSVEAAVEWLDKQPS